MKITVKVISQSKYTGSFIQQQLTDWIWSGKINLFNVLSMISVQNLSCSFNHLTQKQEVPLEFSLY